MIRVHQYRDKSVAVLGLGRSGMAAARALAAGGATVLSWDDDPSRCQADDAGALAFSDLGEADFEDISALVLSPGIPLTHPAPHPVVRRARAAGCPVIGDIDLFANAVTDAAVVGVTGSNGKSTTTALVGHLLEACGRPVVTGGNLGRPALDLPELDADGVYVLELSSFQIDLAPSLVCDVAVLLNLSPDHLDRHGDMAGYVAVKKRLLLQQSTSGTAIVGVDDRESATILEDLQSAQRQRVIPVGVGRAIEGGVYVIDGVLYDATADTVVSRQLTGIESLIGIHNWQNAAAAIAVVAALGIPVAPAMRALAGFPGLPHRLEAIATIDGVRFVNDSKATNADAAARALATFENIHWIAGGVAKAGGIAALGPYLHRIAHAYLIGEAATAFAATLGDHVPHTSCGDLASALAAAFAGARAGPVGAVVLLSPACASFDQWPNFEARGDDFRGQVHALLHDFEGRQGAASC